MAEVVIRHVKKRAGHAGPTEARPQPHGDAASKFFPALKVAGDLIPSARVKFHQEPSRSLAECFSPSVSLVFHADHGTRERFGNVRKIVGEIQNE